MDEVIDDHGAGEIIPPFFVMGCEASGTNLVSLILDSHSRLAVCRGTHYYLLFAPERRYYGNLRKRSNLIRLITDFAATARAHRVDVPELDDLLRAVRAPSFEGVLGAFLQLYARRQGKVRAGERSAKHYLFLPEVLRAFPDSPVVYTMRDPRDLALAHKEGFGFDVEMATASWTQALHCYQHASRPVHLVRYEDLVRRPRETVEGICAFLGERFEPGMLKFYERTPDHYHPLPHHQRLFGPLDEGSVGSFRQLSQHEIARIEERCAAGMQAMGYEPDGARSTVAASEAPREQAPEKVSLLRHVLGRILYYGRDRDRWRRGLLHWRIVLRARARYVLHLGFWRDDW